MLPLNLLLLPLLGGFIFVSKWHPSRFVILRTEGYRLLFHSALAGLSLLFLAALLAFALPNIPSRFVLLVEVSRFIDSSWHKVAPVPYSGTAVLALILGSLLWWPLNYLVLPRNYQIDAVIHRKGDALEMLMRGAMGKCKPILVHLKNHGVYVGYVTTNFNPISSTQYVKILPLYAGYFKDDPTHITFTDFYGRLYVTRRNKAKESESETRFSDPQKSQEQLLHNIEDEVNLKDFELVLPIAEIQSVAMYSSNSKEQKTK